MLAISRSTRIITASTAPVMIPQMRRLLRLLSLWAFASAGSAMLRSLMEMALSVKAFGLSS